MIEVIQEGNYKLIETKMQHKILTLDSKIAYAWVNIEGIGEMLVASHRPHQTDNLLAIGSYRIYNVKEEPKLTDLQHLELAVGGGMWQGYLLPRGLPKDDDRRVRIIPTDQVITNSVPTFE